MESRFSAKVVPEGSKRWPRITIPREAARALPAPCWIRTRLGDREPIFVFARKAPSRTSTDFAVPHWLPDLPHDHIRLHRRLNVTIENAARFRAAPTTVLTGTDWLPFVDVERYFPVDLENNGLAVWSRHEEPFFMNRVTPQESMRTLLRLYRTCGTHGEAREFSLTLPRNDSRDVVALLEMLGISAENVHIRDNSPYTDVLRVRKSLPFLRMVKALLAHRRRTK